MYTPATSVYNVTTTELPLVGSLTTQPMPKTSKYAFSTAFGLVPIPPPNTIKYEQVCSFSTITCPFPHTPLVFTTNRGQLIFCQHHSSSTWHPPARTSGWIFLFTVQYIIYFYINMGCSFAITTAVPKNVCACFLWWLASWKLAKHIKKAGTRTCHTLWWPSRTSASTLMNACHYTN